MGSINTLLFLAFLIGLGLGYLWGQARREAKVNQPMMRTVSARSKRSTRKKKR